MSQKPAGEKIQENVQNVVTEAKQEVAAARRPWYHAIRWGFILLGIYTVQLALFGLLAFWVHIHPVLPIDIAITREIQENQAPWLRFTMIVISYLGYNFPLFSLLIILTAVIFWTLRLRLEAIIVVGLSVVSALLNALIKFLVARPRPTASLVEII